MQDHDRTVESLPRWRALSFRCRRPGVQEVAVPLPGVVDDWCEPSVPSARPPNRIVRFLSLSYAKQCERRFPGPVFPRLVPRGAIPLPSSRAHWSRPSPSPRRPDRLTAPASTFWSNEVRASVRSEVPCFFLRRCVHSAPCEHPSVSNAWPARVHPDQQGTTAWRVESHRVSGFGLAAESL